MTGDPVISTQYLKANVDGEANEVVALHRRFTAFVGEVSASKPVMVIVPVLTADASVGVPKLHVSVPPLLTAENGTLPPRD